MKLSRNTFTKGMNTNLSSEVIPNDMFIMAGNAIYSGEGQDGSLSNFKGTTQIDLSVRNWRDVGVNVASDWICNGVIKSVDEDYIYLFMHAQTAGSPTGDDYSDRNMILRYQIGASNVSSTVLAGFDSWIQFDQEIKDSNCIDFRGSQYLFWINGDGTPYKINVQDAIQMTDDEQYSTVPYDEFISTVSVIQTPPLFPPTIEYIHDNSLGVNSYIEGLYSFKYRYVYKNGGVSAFSPVSRVFHDPVVATPADTASSIYYNAVIIDYNISNSNVDRVEIAFKNGAVWYTVPTIKSLGVGDHQYTFTTDNISIALGENPTETKYYDNVPVTANTQEFIENKIIYGNYIDSYDSNFDVNLTVSDKYNPLYSDVTAIPIQYGTQVYDSQHISQEDGESLTQNNELRIYLSDIQANASVGDLIHWRFVINTYHRAEVDNLIQRLEIKSSGSILYTSDAAVMASLRTALEASTYATITNTYEDNNIVPKVWDDVASISVTDNTTYVGLRVNTGNSIFYGVPAPYRTVAYVGITGTASIYPLFNSTSLFSTPNEASTSFKMGASHEFGIVYYDKYNRQSDVMTGDASSVYMKWLVERDEETNQGDGSSDVPWHIDTTPPEWATHYQIVYSKNTVTREFDTYICDDMSVDTDIHSKPTGLYRIHMRSLDRFIDNNKNTSLKYTNGEGDVLVMTGVYDGTEINRDISNLSARIIGEGYDDTGLTSYVLISAESYTLITEYISQFGYDSQWGDRFIMEIRNPRITEADGLYYEIGQCYEIGDAGLGTRYHKGEIRDQNEDLSTYSLTNQTATRWNNNSYRVTLSSGSPLTWKIGDMITISSNVGGDTQPDLYAQIYDIERDVTDTFDEHMYFNLFGSELIDDAYTKDITAIEGATGLIKNGDAYIRSRVYNPLWGVGGDPWPIAVIAESPMPSDAYKVLNYGFGRSQIEKKDKNVVDRRAGLISSQNLNEDTNFFGTTSFPNTSFDWVDLDNSFGAIDKIVNMNDNLYVLQDSRIGIQLVSKDILTSATGEGQVALTSKVFGNFVTIGDGIGTRGSAKGYVQDFEGILFFVDPDNNSIYRVSGKQLKNISENSIKSLLLSDSYGNGKSGIIPRRKEYVISLDDGLYVYNSVNDIWVPKWNITPDQIVSANGTWLTTYNDKLYKHEDDSVTYNTLYNNAGNIITATPYVTIASNEKAYMNKSYNSVSLRGGGLNNSYISSVKTNTMRSDDIYPVNKEGIMFGAIAGGYYLDSTVSHRLLGIGIAKGNTIDTVTFSEIPHYVTVGDLLYQYDSGGDVMSLVGSITDITGNVLTIGTVVTAIDYTNFFTIAKPSNKDGSDLKGTYVEMTVYFGDDTNKSYLTSVELEGIGSPVND